MAIAAELVRERAHVAGALHVVLATQRIDAHAFTTEVARDHREVGDAHDHRRALTVLGHSEAIVDRAIAGTGIQARGLSHEICRYTGDCFSGLGRIPRIRHESLPARERVGLAALGDIVLAAQPFRHDHVRQRIDQRHIRSRAQLQVIVGGNMRCAHDADLPRIHDDQPWLPAAVAASSAMRRPDVLPSRSRRSA